MKDIFEQMAHKWPSSIVSRSEVGNFSGGAVSPKFLANADSAGFGPAEKIMIGKRVCYPVDAFTAWLRARTKEH